MDNNNTMIIATDSMTIFDGNDTNTINTNTHNNHNEKTGRIITEY